jgi:hypothetical protein
LADNNPDVRVVPLEQTAFKKAIEEMSVWIRAGKVRGVRLQEWYRTRFGYAQTSKQWLQALLEAEQFWGPPRRLSRAPKLHEVLSQRAWKIIAK